MVRSAEEWLEERGVERQPIRVQPPTEEERKRAEISAREARRLAEASPPQPAEEPGERRPPLEDEVTAAVATARRSTARAPKSETRLAERLSSKGYSDVVVDLAMERCRKEGIVDDRAYAQIFTEERRQKGHAAFRIRQDLDKRGIPEAIIDEVLSYEDREDREAAAFAVAKDRARTMRDADPEAAFRRLVGYVARRGYPEALARKVCRQVLWDDREQARIAER